MKTVPLGEIVTFKGGGTPDKSVSGYWGGDVPWASVKDFKSTSISRTTDYITQEGVKNSATNIIPAGTIIVPTRMAVGKAAICTIDVAINQDLKALLPSKHVETRYLLHALLASSGELERHATGATVKGITLDVLRKLQIPLPSLLEQRRIAAILDQAGGLRRLRRDSLDRLGDLGQAIFYEMFGDVVANDRQLPVVTLDEYISGFDTGKNLAPDPDNESAANRVLKISAVTSGRFDPKEAKPLPNTYRPPASHFVRNGDLLFSRANTAALIGATAIVNDASDNLVLPDKLWRFQWHGRAEAVFTHHLFQSPPMRAEISRRASGTSGSMKNISKGKVLSIRLGLPGAEQRQEFERRIMKGQNVMDAAREALAQAEKLFSSLQHRAFRGEL